MPPIPQPPSDILAPWGREIDAAARLLRDYLAQSNPADVGDGLVQFSATWNAALTEARVEELQLPEGRFEEPDRREILKNSYRWLRARATQRQKYHEELGTFLDRCLEDGAFQGTSVARAAREQGVSRLESALGGVSTAIEKYRPEVVIRDGAGDVSLSWTEDPAPLDAQVRWVRDPRKDGSFSLRGASLRAFSVHARLPGGEATLFAEHLVREVAFVHALAIPHFNYPPVLKQGEKPSELHWRAATVDAETVSEGQLPAWLQRGQPAPPEVVPPGEREGSRPGRELGERLDALLGAVAERDLKAERGGATGSPRAIDLLVGELARRTGRSVAEIAEVLAEVVRRRAAHNSEECVADRAALVALQSHFSRET